MSGRPSEGAVIGDAVPARHPLQCRRGIREFQGRRLPRCHGILEADLDAVRVMCRVGDRAVVRCPECGLGHGFALAGEELLYGTIL